MARRQKIEIGGLNIKAHPHDAGTYGSLIEALYGLKKITKIHGDRYGLITMISRSDEDENLVFGVLSTFLEIEIDGEWFNTETMEEASDNDVSSINIPDYLHPNLKTFRFMFNLKQHELVFEHYADGDRLTHHSALNFFRNLTSERQILKKFGDIKVNLITDRGNVDRIFAIPRITELDILIERPNSDLWGEDFEDQAEQHLEDKNARSMNVQYKAEKGQGIRRDEDLDALIRASINNGRSVAKGYGVDGHMLVSTDDYPKVIQELYDQDIESGTVFRRLARTFRR